MEAPSDEAEAPVESEPEPSAEPEAPEIIDGPRNFVTPHHCHPPGPCSFAFETLRGVQHLDVGHGHESAPRLNVALRVGEGEAQVEVLAADTDTDAQGSVIARPRDSLEGGAYYVTVRGAASDVEVELAFEK